MSTKVYSDTVLKQQALDGLSKLSDVAPVLDGARKAAAERFVESEFPSIRHEEWKYTNVKRLVGHAFDFSAESQMQREALSSFLIDGLDANLMVFVNGRFREDLSSVEVVKGVVAMNLQDAAVAYPEVVLEHFGRYAQLDDQAFIAMNTAFAQHGAFVHVSKGIEVEKPLQLLYITDASVADVVSQPRNLIVLEQGARLTLVEDAVTLGDRACFINAVTEISVATDAALDHYKMQTEKQNTHEIVTTAVYQHGKSFYSNTLLATDGGLIRNNLSIALDGEHSEAFMNGLCLLNGRDHVDNHTLVDHRMPNCYSNELYKGILNGQATGVFNGKIYVQQDAQKTNAYQSNKNILLSADAKMYTKPQLEIWADDVKCSHGCTVGTLDLEPLFYLRARGISEQKAKAMLTFAFAADILDRIKVPALRVYAEKILAERLDYDFD